MTMAHERLSSDERRRQIADAALQILASQGAHRVTAMEIATAVGISDAAVFRHFRDKNEIIAAAIARFEELLEGDAVDAGDDPLASLGGFFVRRLEKARAHPLILRLAFNDRLAEIAGPEQAARVSQVVGRSVGFVRGCVEQAQRRSLVADDVPAQVLVWMVIGCLRGAATAPRGPGATPSPEDVWGDVEALLRRTASPRRHAPRPGARGPRARRPRTPR